MAISKRLLQSMRAARQFKAGDSVWMTPPSTTRGRKRKSVRMTFIKCASGEVIVAWLFVVDPTRVRRRKARTVAVSAFRTRKRR